MMSHGFFDTFREFLSRFREDCRAREFKRFLMSLAEWRISQILRILMKEKICDWEGDLIPDQLNFIWVGLLRVENELNYYHDLEMWEDRYYQAYMKLYYMYEQVAMTFPKEEQPIFFMHDIPPTSLFEFLYRYFFPEETARILDSYKGSDIFRW